MNILSLVKVDPKGNKLQVTSVLFVLTVQVDSKQDSDKLFTRNVFRTQRSHYNMDNVDILHDDVISLWRNGVKNRVSKIKI